MANIFSQRVSPSPQIQASIELILKHNNLLLKRKTFAIENNLLQYNIKENMNNIKG